MGRMEAAREQRLAEQLARRGTPEFVAAGQALVARRECEAEERARAAAAEREQRAIDNMERAMAAVPYAVLAKHQAAFETMLDEAAADSGYERDVIASDILDAYVGVTFLPSKRNAAIALELYRVELGCGPADGWARLRRVGAR